MRVKSLDDRLYVHLFTSAAGESALSCGRINNEKIARSRLDFAVQKSIWIINPCTYRNGRANNVEDYPLELNNRSKSALESRN